MVKTKIRGRPIRPYRLFNTVDTNGAMNGWGEGLYYGFTYRNDVQHITFFKNINDRWRKVFGPVKTDEYLAVCRLLGGGANADYITNLSTKKYETLKMLTILGG